jgi:putative DNA methylase
LTRNEISKTSASQTKNNIYSGIIWLLTQQLTSALEQTGVVGAAKIVSAIISSEPDLAKALAYRLFTIADRKGWTQDAYAYNSLVVAWPDVQSKAAELQAATKRDKPMTIIG